MSNPINIAPQRRKGAALIMALLVTSIAASLSSLLLVRIDHWLNRVEISGHYAQSRALARSALDYAMAILVEDMLRTSIDHLNEDWARRLPPILSEGSEINGHIEDMQGRWNLNNLRYWSNKNPGPLKVTQRLFEFSDLHPDQAEVLLDWVDNNDQPQPNGAESAYYLGLRPPYTAANKSIDNIAVLKRLKGFDQASVDRLVPLAAALPIEQPINVNTAPAEVLAAIVPGMSLAQARSMVIERKSKYYLDAADFAKYLPYPDMKIIHPISTKSNFFLVHISVSYGKAQTHLQALISRLGNPQILWMQLS